MSIPSVSVCIPTYNYGQYIPQAVDSVLSQTFTDFELLIVDDCSNDSTDEILREYVRQDSRIRYIRHPTNLGMVENWNYCIRHARGKYIKYLFGDDFFASDRMLEKMFLILESDESISLVSSARKIVNDKSVQIDLWTYADKNTIADGLDVIHRCLLTATNPIGEPSAVMFRAAHADRGFNWQYRQLVDLEMWFHLLEKGRYAFLSEPLCSFRVHNEQQTCKNGKPNSLLELYRIYEDFLCKKYISFGSVDKAFLPYDVIYQIWKFFHQHNELHPKLTDTYIAYYGKKKFYFLYPIYKSYKPFRKLRKHIENKSKAT